jgi:diguanylate cyclase (GGDEF)-like protein/PAS domain S-box-containing protein
MWRAVAALVLVVGSAVSLVGAWAWHVSLANTARQRFDLAAQGLKETVANSLRHYDDLVGVLGSVFSQPELPTRAQFSSLVQGFNLAGRYRGVFGVGFAALVQPGDLGAFVASARHEVPGYAPFLLGARPPYCLGSYATWSGPTQRLPLLGLDLCAYPFLEKALYTARDSGQEEIVPGSALGQAWAADFAFIAPVYSGQSGSVAERQAHLVGWVAGLVDGPQMAKAMLGSGGLTSELGIELFTASGTSRDDLVLSTLPSKGTRTPSPGAESFHLVTAASWTLRVFPLGGTWAAGSVLVPVVALVLGLFGNLVLTLFIASLGYGRALALRKVEQATRSWRESQEQFSSLAACSPVGIMQLSPEGQVTYANSRMAEITGKEVPELSGRGWLEAIDPDEMERFSTLAAGARQDQKGVDTELRLRRKDGEVRRARVLSAPIVSETAETSGWVVNVHDVTEEVAAHEALAFQALHGPLTGLPNRALFVDRVAQALAGRDGDGHVAVLLLDLDYFRVINDSLGHLAGDTVLEEVAERLSAVVRSGETVARLGGDEFTLLLEDVPDISAAVKVTRRVTESLSDPFQVGADKHETVVTASIGIVLADRTTSAEEVLRDADTAMNRAKAAGRARYEIFEKEHLRRALGDSGADAERLCAEVTETVLMADSETTRGSVAELRRLGLSIGIDDFGTGYSSLAYLQTLPARFLKIDRSFMNGLGTGSATETIVTSVVEIAHALGLRVVAEGVEEGPQLEFLKRCRCDLGQGYFWARPMPPTEFVEWAHRREIGTSYNSNGRASRVAVARS